MSEPIVNPLSYASSGVKPVKPQVPGRVWRWVASLCAGMIVLLGVFVLLPRTGETAGPPDRVFIVRPAVEVMLPVLALAGLGLGCGAAVLLFRYRRVLIGMVVVAGVGVGGLVAAAAFLVHGLAPWIVYDEVTGSDGLQYCFIDSSFLQGQTMAIARRDSGSLLYQNFTVMGTTNGDAPRSFLRIAIPNPKGIPYGALYATPDGLLVGVRFGNDCYMVYDLTMQRFYGHGDVETLSPNVLVWPRAQTLR